MCHHHPLNLYRVAGHVRARARAVLHVLKGWQERTHSTRTREAIPGSSELCISLKRVKDGAAHHSLARQNIRGLSPFGFQSPLKKPSPRRAVRGDITESCG